MAKISFNKLNLNKNTEIKTISINGQDVEVLQYLPVQDKINLIQRTVDEAFIGAYHSPMLIDALLHIGIVLEYTNIAFSPAQKEKLLETYDLLEKTGVIELVISNIPLAEYDSIIESLEKSVLIEEKNASSLLSLLETGIERIAETITSATDSLEGLNLNSENIQTVLKIAEDNGAI